MITNKISTILVTVMALNFIVTNIVFAGSQGAYSVELGTFGFRGSLGTTRELQLNNLYSLKQSLNEHSKLENFTSTNTDTEHHYLQTIFHNTKTFLAEVHNYSVWKILRFKITNLYNHTLYFQRVKINLNTIYLL